MTRGIFRPRIKMDRESSALVRELAAAMDKPEADVVAGAVRLLGITYALRHSATGGRTAVGWALDGDAEVYGGVN